MEEDTLMFKMKVGKNLNKDSKKENAIYHKNSFHDNIPMDDGKILISFYIILFQTTHVL